MTGFDFQKLTDVIVGVNSYISIAHADAYFATRSFGLNERAVMSDVRHALSDIKGNG
jgi:hypothetical protein